MKTWIGGATAQTQVDTFTISGAGGGSETHTLTITDEGGGTRTVTFTDDGTPTAAEISAGLVAAWNDDSYAAALATAADTTGAFTLTAATSGAPFSVALTHSGTATSSRAATTENRGPNDYNTVANWSEGAIPVANDDVKITGSNNITYGLDQSSVELDDFTYDETATCQIGTSQFALKIDVGDVDTLTLAGTGRVYLNIGAANPTIIIKNSATVSDPDAAIQLTATALSKNLDFRKGSLRLVGSTLTGDIVQTYVSNQDNDTRLYVPVGNTLTTSDLKKTGGQAVIDVAIATISNDGGKTTTRGSGAVPTINCDGGLVVSNSSGTVSAANADGTGEIDFTQSNVARTCTDHSVNGAGKIYFHGAIITATNAGTSSGPYTVTAG